MYALDLKVISSNNNQLFKHCIYQDNGVRTSLYRKTNSKNLVVNQYCGYKKYLHSRINSYCCMKSIVLRVR